MNIKLLFLSIFVPAVFVFTPLAFSAQPAVAQDQGAGIATTSCPGGDFMGIPPWHKFIKKDPGKACALVLDFPQDIWKIVLGIFDILIRVSAYIAVGFIIWGGIRMIVSQGDPNGIKEARDTAVNAVVGLVIALLATTIVSFVAGIL